MRRHVTLEFTVPGTQRLALYAAALCRTASSAHARASRESASHTRASSFRAPPGRSIERKQIDAFNNISAALRGQPEPSGNAICLGFPWSLFNQMTIRRRRQRDHARTEAIRAI